jgi:hypothetical protein
VALFCNSASGGTFSSTAIEIIKWVKKFAVAQAKVTHILRPGKASEKTPKGVIPPSLREISQNASREKKAEQKQFLPTEQREEDSDFYGYDEEEEENVEGDELNACFSQPPSMATWVTDFALGYFPGAEKADNVRTEQAREKEWQRARAEEEMQEEFCVHNEKNLAAQKARQLDKKGKKEQTRTRVSARIRGKKLPENKDNKVKIPRLIRERKKKKS